MGALAQHLSSPVNGGGAAAGGGGGSVPTPPLAFGHSSRKRGEKENSYA